MQPTSEISVLPTTLRQAGLLQQYWRKQCQDHHNDTSSERTYQTIADAMNQLDPTFELPARDSTIPIEIICTEFTAATKALKEAQRKKQDPSATNSNLNSSGG